MSVEPTRFTNPTQEEAGAPSTAPMPAESMPTDPMPAESTESEEIDRLVDILPETIRRRIHETGSLSDLVEIVLDLGRHPEVRTYSDRSVFEDIEIRADDIEHVIAGIGAFGDDNRAGIARTLHRISAIRNRAGRVIGLTLRAGRAIYGTAEIVRDIFESGNSVLLVGRPGVGKTTMLRETARLLAEHKRVVIVDTSNEIAGDGDIPHPAIGRARRMQVMTPALQHEVMIEAVENHNPEVIVIDEIGRELEAMAARTIAERGVQLIGTAHGNTLENVMMNPTLSDLVGGIESVTLSDEEARRRGTQKSVLERRAPPTFDSAIEIQGWQRLALHPDVGLAIDSLLRGRPLAPEIRFRGEDGEVMVESLAPEPPSARRPQRAVTVRPIAEHKLLSAEDDRADESIDALDLERQVALPTRTVYAYGVNQGRLRRAAVAVGVPLHIVDDLTEANALFILKSYFRNRPVVINDAEARGIPIFILRNNTNTNIERALVDLYGLSPTTTASERALRETRDAIRSVLSGSRTMIELSPQAAPIRKQQHDMARQANLSSLSRGKEPRRRVRIMHYDG